MQLSIIVSNWNGSAWIARCVSSLLLSARTWGGEFELIVVDDASDDDSADIVAQRFPAARLLRNERNVGFGPATMRGVRAARGGVVVLCNNDLAPTEDFVRNLARWFEPGAPTLADGTRVPRRRLFAVSSRTMAWSDGRPNHAWMGAAWRGGRIAPTWRLPDGAERTLFVQAGAAAYDREALLRLGGLRDIFRPGYWEDYDLSWRAAARGLACVYDPQAVAIHHGGGSMTKRFGAEGVARARARNHLLFEWINLRDAGLLARYAARLPISVAREWLGGGEPRLTRALVEALQLAPAAIAERMARSASVRDAEILDRFGKGEPTS